MEMEQCAVCGNDIILLEEEMESSIDLFSVDDKVVCFECWLDADDTGEY